MRFRRVYALTPKTRDRYPPKSSLAVMERVGMTFWKRELTNGLDTIYYAIDAPG